MGEAQDLSASLEDYLEAIYHIVERKQAARAKDISDRLSVNSSSVTGALRALSDRDLVNYAPYDIVTLTAEGEKVAKGIVRRHQALHDFFIKVLRIEEPDAQDAACKMEHALPQYVVERLRRFVAFFEHAPVSAQDWMEEGMAASAKAGRKGSAGTPARAPKPRARKKPRK